MTNLRNPVPLRPVTLPRSAWLSAWIVAIVGFVFLTVPRPSGWVGDHVHKEDGDTFLTTFLRSGFSSTFDLYSGHLHVGPRLIAGVCATLTPPEAFPACVLIATNSVRTALVLLAFPLFTAVARSWRWGLAASSTFVFLAAGQQEILGNITNLRWILVAGTAVALLHRRRSWPLDALAVVTCVLGPLSDPLTILLIPLAILVLVRRRGRSLSALAYLPSVTFQALSMRPADRAVDPSASLFANPANLAMQLSIRGPVASQFGITGTEGLMRLGGPGLAMAAMLLPLTLVIFAVLRTWRTQRPSALFLVGWTILAMALLGATLAFANGPSLDLQTWWTAGDTARYSSLCGLFVVPVAVVAASWLVGSASPRRARWLGWVCMGVLCVSVMADFRGDSWNTHGPSWTATVRQARLDCASGATTLTVPVTPQGVPMAWTAVLPCSWLKGSS